MGAAGEGTMWLDVGLQSRATSGNGAEPQACEDMRNLVAKGSPRARWQLFSSNKQEEPCEFSANWHLFLYCIGSSSLWKLFWHSVAFFFFHLCPVLNKDVCTPRGF